MSEFGVLKNYYRRRFMTIVLNILPHWTMLYNGNWLYLIGSLAGFVVSCQLSVKVFIIIISSNSLVPVLREPTMADAMLISLEPKCCVFVLPGFSILNNARFIMNVCFVTTSINLSLLFQCRIYLGLYFQCRVCTCSDRVLTLPGCSSETRLKPKPREISLAP